MIFTPTPLEGAWLIDVEPHRDARGFFARTVCVQSFLDKGIDGRFVQQSVSWNPKAGTLRGMHFQTSEHSEDKLVRCTRGRIHDVIIDLRSGSASRGRWFAVELSAENRRQLWVPRGFAHGFQTLEDGCEVLYEMTRPFVAGASMGIRWDDPAIGIHWPIEVADHDPSRLSHADANWPKWTP